MNPQVTAAFRNQSRDLRELTRGLGRATLAWTTLTQLSATDPRVHIPSVRQTIRDPRFQFQLTEMDPRVRALLGRSSVRDPRVTTLLAFARIHWVQIVSQPFPMAARLTP